MPLRRPLVAGQFYPAHATELAGEIQAFLCQKTILTDVSGNSADACPKTSALLALLPHAGYIYCGSVIGATLARIALPSRLVLLGPNHSGLGAPLAVWPEGAWQTPLGDTPIDDAMVTELLKAPLSGTTYSADTVAHQREHSLEVLLPFLQRLIPDLRITPVCVACPPADLEAAGLALARAIRRQAALGQAVGIIVSSDMNHYADHERTLHLDGLALAPFLELDPVRLFNTVAEQGISMCGVLPATLGLFACRGLGASAAELVRHTSSAEASGDTRRVVGYAGAYVPCP